MNTIINFSDSLAPSTITKIIVDKFKNSDSIKMIRTADNYYSVNNEEINTKSSTYYDRDRKPHNNPNASNVKIKSNFLRMLVQQKKDYGFSKPFIFLLSDENENEIELDDNEYGKEWNKFLKKQLFDKISSVAGLAINHGISWVYLWIDDDGELNIKELSAEYVYPIWKDTQHDDLNRLVYNYQIEKYNSSSPETKEYAEYWDDDTRIIFDVDDYTQVVDNTDSEGNPMNYHMTDGEDGVSWGKIPFVAFKGTDDEMPMLSFVKEYIDAYDKLSSRSVDTLIDELDPLLIFKGISPEFNSLLEAREVAKLTKTMALDTDGDARYITTQSNVAQYLERMSNLKLDIIKFGYGVDFDDVRFGGNPNQMVIKSLYQNLDTYMDGLERQFQKFINKLKYFFDRWYELMGKGSFDEVKRYTIKVKLDKSMMINNSSMIDDTVKLSGTGISKKTILEFNPIVQDVDLEMERIEEERKKEMEDNDLFDFTSQQKGLTDE